MRPDEEGFLQPVIDKAKCVHCGKCDNVCPVLHHGKPRKPLAVYAAKAKDDGLRAGSASGGIFTLLALDVLKRGGVVFGAGFERPSWRVIHKAAHNAEELDDLRGSKYVQSDVGNTYTEAKRLLDGGKEVLYSGCPCQIAALLNFLGKPYPNLTTVDLICHGVPSPLAWRKYLDDREREAGAHITLIHSRRYCKWRNYSISIRFENDAEYSKDNSHDPYLTAFSRDWMLRKNCLSCKFRKLRSRSTITIGDHWEAHGDQDATSLVLVNAKISDLFNSEAFIKQDQQHFQHTISRSLATNGRMSRLRSPFLRAIRETQDFDRLCLNFISMRDSSIFIHLAWWLKRLIINGEVNKF